MGMFNSVKLGLFISVCCWDCHDVCCWDCHDVCCRDCHDVYCWDCHDVGCWDCHDVCCWDCHDVYCWDCHDVCCWNCHGDLCFIFRCCRLQLQFLFCILDRIQWTVTPSRWCKDCLDCWGCVHRKWLIFAKNSWSLLATFSPQSCATVCITFGWFFGLKFGSFFYLFIFYGFF